MGAEMITISIMLVGMMVLCLSLYIFGLRVRLSKMMALSIWEKMDILDEHCNEARNALNEILLPTFMADVSLRPSFPRLQSEQFNLPVRPLDELLNFSCPLDMSGPIRALRQAMEAAQRAAEAAARAAQIAAEAAAREAEEAAKAVAKGAKKAWKAVSGLFGGGSGAHEEIQELAKSELRPFYDGLTKPAPSFDIVYFSTQIENNHHALQKVSADLRQKSQKLQTEIANKLAHEVSTAPAQMRNGVRVLTQLMISDMKNFKIDVCEIARRLAIIVIGTWYNFLFQFALPFLIQFVCNFLNGLLEICEIFTESSLMVLLNILRKCSKVANHAFMSCKAIISLLLFGLVLNPIVFVFVWGIPKALALTTILASTFLDKKTQNQLAGVSVLLLFLGLCNTYKGYNVIYQVTRFLFTGIQRKR